MSTEQAQEIIKLLHSIDMTGNFVIAALVTLVVIALMKEGK